MADIIIQVIVSNTHIEIHNNFTNDIKHIYPVLDDMLMYGYVSQLYIKFNNNKKAINYRVMKRLEYYLRNYFINIGKLYIFIETKQNLQNTYFMSAIIKIQYISELYINTTCSIYASHMRSTVYKDLLIGNNIKFLLKHSRNIKGLHIDGIIIHNELYQFLKKLVGLPKYKLESIDVLHDTY